MRFLLVAILAFIAVQISAQIAATTSAGKKVLLNADGTWKYADAGQDEKPCHKNHTGNLSIKNVTNNDLYFYYAKSDYEKAEYVKVKANAAKTISDLYVGNFDWQGKLSFAHNYKWKALLELVETNYTFNYIKGAVETGSFMVEECGLKEIVIGD